MKTEIAVAAMNLAVEAVVYRTRWQMRQSLPTQLQLRHPAQAPALEEAAAGRSAGRASTELVATRHYGLLDRRQHVCGRDPPPPLGRSLSPRRRP